MLQAKSPLGRDQQHAGATVFELMQQCGWRILPPKDEQTACCGG
jgi:hypothetical protein